ncbi:hypothetical protein SEA_PAULODIABOLI_340 [Microbacterium phage PauloDiaboli]|nr:hypothetical protein SEA_PAULODIABOLI_340 [Microbacterium phage PauloDiaboli]
MDNEEEVMNELQAQKVTVELTGLDLAILGAWNIWAGRAGAPVVKTIESDALLAKLVIAKRDAEKGSAL